MDDTAVVVEPLPETEGSTPEELGITTEWVLLTPELASQFLEANFNNRHVREEHLKRLVEDMNKQQFRITHQGLAFDSDGVLSDGQHRCMAVVRSGQSIWTLVTRNLPPESRNGFDRGSKRAVYDGMPGKHRAAKTGAIKLLLATERLGNVISPSAINEKMRTVTDQDQREAWDRWPILTEVTDLAHKASRNIRAGGPSALLACAVIYPDSAEEFLRGLVDLTGFEAGDPRLALVRYTGSVHLKRQQGPTAFFMCMKAAKAFDEGYALSALRSSGWNEKAKLHTARR